MSQQKITHFIEKDRHGHIKADVPISVPITDQEGDSEALAMSQKGVTEIAEELREAIGGSGGGSIRDDITTLQGKVGTLEGKSVEIESAIEDLQEGLADAGKVDDIEVNGDTVVDPVTKKASITVPTKVSDLPNDSKYQTESQVNAKVAAAAVNEVNVSVDGTSGNPSVTKTYANGILDMAFSGLKGEKGDKLTWNDLTDEQKTSLKGEQGATGVYDATTQDFLTTLETTIGSSQTKTMTQGSITEEVLPIKDAPAMRVPGKDTGYLKNDGTIATTSSSYKVTDYVMLEEGQTKIHIVSGVWKPSSYSQVCFYSQPDEEHFVDKINEGTASTERTNVDYDIPSTARYCRFTVKPDVDAIITVKGSFVKRLESLESNMTDVETAVGTIGNTVNQSASDVNEMKSLLRIDKRLYPAAETGKLLKETGIATGTSAKYGVTDYIPLAAGDTPFVISGAYKGGQTWAFCAFYSEQSESSFVGFQSFSTQNTEVTNTAIVVPDGAAYMRLSMKDNTIPVVVRFSEPVDLVAMAEEMQALEAKIAPPTPQIKNNPLPIKETSQPLKVLYIGSSYGVDTIDAYVDICKSVGLDVTTYDSFISGGTLANYLALVESGSDAYAIYANTSNPPQNWNHTPRHSITALIKKEPWDIIILEDEDVRKPAYSAEKKAELATFLQFVKYNCTNPRVVIALNSTWTWSSNMDKQNDSFKVAQKDMANTGIDVIIPSGAAINLLRQTDVNDGHDIYRDDIHLNVGVGRFTAACAFYFATAYYIYGVELTNCDVTGKWDVDGSIVNTNPIIEVDSTNRSICIECAKKANANRFLL